MQKPLRLSPVRLVPIIFNDSVSPALSTQQCSRRAQLTPSLLDRERSRHFPDIGSGQSETGTNFSLLLKQLILTIHGSTRLELFSLFVARCKLYLRRPNEHVCEAHLLSG